LEKLLVGKGGGRHRCGKESKGKVEKVKEMNTKIEREEIRRIEDVGKCKNSLFCFFAVNLNNAAG
jgi:hypothetical protein